MLRIDDLELKVGARTILNGFHFVLHRGEKAVMFGPNGAGKSSLIYAILGYPGYQVTRGKIFFQGRDITELPTNERVKLGLGVSFQNPPAIRGIKLSEMLNVCRPGISPDEAARRAAELNLTDFLARDINLGFSGGEVKRSELLQIIAQQPALALFDEPDSGVDLENVELLGRRINAYLKDNSGLIITHQGYILNFIEVTRACVLYDGRVVCSGDPKGILEDIRQKGYEGCVKCRVRKNDEK
ncbi:MAG: ABC transporter ATP-binding protein [Candidatus Margulisbacteria bacterium]|nr:ABC transporter ATP-binding protein [Candidatus Margulisiibacteriota bacterium]